MKTLSRHEGTLYVLDRMPNSRNGNPRFRLFIGTETSGVSCVTAPDSSLGYTVQNYAGQRVRVLIGTHYGRATLNHIEQVEEATP
jgi:hypothetical protein